MTTNSKANGFAIALQKYFLGLHGSRIKFIEKIIPAIVKASSVTLEKIACAFESEVQVSSTLRRIRRFVKKAPLTQDQMAIFVTNLLGITGPMTIAIDRTNWMFGSLPINIFMLSVKWKSKSIPLYWIMLDKEGNSNYHERIDLIQKLLNTFGPNCIASLTADREFIGRDWFEWLLNKDIPFDIRIKSNTQIDCNGQTIAVSELFRHMNPGQFRQHKKVYRIFGCDVYLSGGPAKGKKGEDDYFIIASDAYRPDADKRYGLRWRIEQLFKELKSNGFDLEQTHLAKPERLSTLLILLAIAYTWILKVGQHLADCKYPLTASHLF